MTAIADTEVTPIPTPTIGTPLTTHEMIDALPPGAVMRSVSSGRHFTITAPGMYAGQSGASRSVRRLAVSSGNLVVHSLPGEANEEHADETTVPLEAETPIEFENETLEQFKQRFRTTAMAAQTYSSVNRYAVEQACEALDIPVYDEEPKPGMVVMAADSQFVSALPAHTIIVVGDDPLNYNAYSVWGIGGNGLTRLIGASYFESFTLGRIESMPDVQAPDQGEVDAEAERAAIKEFMVKAWRIGLKAKRENSWCGDFEAAMRRMGITEQTVQSLSAVSAEEARSLPVGSILRATNSQGSVLYVRDDSATNPAGTVRIGGSIPGSWARRVSVEFNPERDSDMSIAVMSHREMDDMPEGTVITDGGGVWTKRAGQARMWSYQNDNHAQYDSSAFSINSLRYSTIPVPASQAPDPAPSVELPF